MNVNPILLSFLLASSVASMQQVHAQETPSISIRQEASIDSLNDVRKSEAKVQTDRRKDTDKQTMSDLKENKRESKQKAKDARRVEKEAANSARASKNAYKAEKRAQKARRHANSEAEKADNAKEKSDKN